MGASNGSGVHTSTDAQTALGCVAHVGGVEVDSPMAADLLRSPTDAMTTTVRLDVVAFAQAGLERPWLRPDASSRLSHRERDLH